MQLKVKLLLHAYAATGPRLAQASHTLLIVPAAACDLELEQQKFVEESQ